VCFVWISEQAVTFASYIINRLVFIAEVESVCCAVRTESLYYSTDSLALKGFTVIRKVGFLIDQWTPRSRILLQKLMVSNLVKNGKEISRVLWNLTVQNNMLVVLSWARWIHTFPSCFLNIKGLLVRTGYRAAAVREVLRKIKLNIWMQVVDRTRNYV
jgi:hypothetical protein